MACLQQHSPNGCLAHPLHSSYRLCPLENERNIRNRLIKTTDSDNYPSFPCESDKSFRSNSLCCLDRKAIVSTLGRTFD
ncbi:hypothetical protein QR680_007235 [Steinernema hermaphroditum]|uniref:Uncharacterized protein n=1 Tax=Steinernema hermaphroditum TaxID=289476 RepID=A0AA39HY72_9BILA|nr:hypothetical protein QR680_007235 [Steinernema hermaphroditum]